MHLFAIGVMNMATKNITLKVDISLYDKYRKLCKTEGLIVSRQFEKLMEKELIKYSGRVN